jgi:SAM-dependent methyltransferase
MAGKRGRPPKVVNPWEGKSGLKLNIGCGKSPIEGYVNIDIATDCDLKLDLEDAKFPFDDDSCDEIFASHVFEHIRNFIPLMNECNRVLKKDGKLIIKVPCYPAPEAFSDPTHVRFFTTRSFEYFDYRSPLFQDHEYGIDPYRFVMPNLQAWNLTVELTK